MVREVHAAFRVDGSLVFGVRVGERRHNVFELADQRFDLCLGESSSRGFPSEFPFDPFSITLRFGDPCRDRGKVSVVTDEVSIASELRLASVELRTQLELACLVVIRVNIADRV